MSRIRAFFGLGPLALAALPACGGDAGGGACNPERESCVLHHDFGTQTVQAGEERSGVCQSWTLHNPTELWVTRVELSNDGSYHHSNWFFVPDDTFELPDGAWDCDSANFSELTAAILGGVLYAQSTQAKHEIQQFPQGAAVRIPPWSRIITSSHLLNVGDTTVTTGLRLTITTLPTNQVAVKLAPFRLAYRDLHIPAKATSRFQSTCDIEATHEDVMKEPFALKLYYVLPHYHALGNRFEVRLAGGSRDGELLHAMDGFDSEPHGKAFDPPIDISGSGAYGFSYSCEFVNGREVEVGWGIGDQEMCEMLGYAETTMAFDAGVNAGDDAYLETLPDGTIVHGGPCSVLGVPFFQDKEGGRGP